MHEKYDHPLTGIGCVKRVYTDLATFACTSQGLQLAEVVDGIEKGELEAILGLPLSIKPG